MTLIRYVVPGAVLLIASLGLWLLGSFVFSNPSTATLWDRMIVDFAVAGMFLAIVAIGVCLYAIRKGWRM